MNCSRCQVDNLVTTSNKALLFITINLQLFYLTGTRWCCDTTYPQQPGSSLDWNAILNDHSFSCLAPNNHEPTTPERSSGTSPGHPPKNCCDFHPCRPKRRCHHLRGEEKWQQVWLLMHLSVF